MEKREMSQSELARKSGITQSTISSLITGRRKLGLEACHAIANAFKLPPETVMRKAGLLPPATKKDELIEKILHELDKLPEDKQDEIYQYIQLQREINEQKATRAIKTKPAGI